MFNTWRGGDEEDVETNSEVRERECFIVTFIYSFVNSDRLHIIRRALKMPVLE